ncbi:Trk system potassium transporter TrkA [Fulvivirga sp. M361]|uniref:Trk system potassium transporter TrkA n=1 Tax=Fulvivirga sp. M361 TaxID=2594266 RepID=UPI00117A9292|nr:Trk system potassium transporter TrkA [Fulvivirga sp. M361]TRX53701.1 Trk system potassium transporter TrkA [Fulvivirga sp. M361]
MRIIIAGAGDVGYHLAKLLAYEEQDIILIDRDGSTLKQAANTLDVGTIKGNSTSYRILDEADISNADLLIAVTSSEETNLTTAIIGKHLGAKKTVARIQNVEYLLNKEKLDLKELGIDEIISPESLAAKEIKRLLKGIALTDTFDFDEGKLSLIGIQVDDNSPIAGKSLIETAHLNPDFNFVTVAILRNNETIIPRGDTQFEPEDHVYFITQPDGTDRVLALSGKEKQEIKNIMILGGSKVGYHAAKRLSRKFKVKLVELEKDKCFELADQLKNVMIINGDARDVELLEEEGISEMDAFIAVTGNSETNIISCLVAKNRNVKKTISLVENIDYIHLSQNIGVDTMINKKLIAANFIFRYIRQGDVVNLTTIHGVDAEILEFIVKAGSKITENMVRDLEFPKGAVIGGVIRNGVGYTAMGDFQFRPKDRAVVLCRPHCIHAVESYFM